MLKIGRSEARDTGDPFRGRKVKRLPGGGNFGATQER